MNRTASNWQLMFAIADSLGEEVGARARTIAQQIAGVTDMASAGVALLQDIKTMFEASTLDHLTSKTIISNLTADTEKPWAEWQRGKPINEKGVASLLREYEIRSRNVGPEGAQAKGYRKADFRDVWERYLAPQKEEEPPEPDILPSGRPAHCNHYTFAENSPVPPGGAGRQKNGHFSNEINARDGKTGEMPEIGASSFSAALGAPEPPPGSPGKGAAPPGGAGGNGTGDDSMPTILRRCQVCGRPGAERWDLNGHAVFLHEGCVPLQNFG